MILDKFTPEIYLTFWEEGWLKDLDSYRINKEGDIVFFSTYNCDNYFKRHLHTYRPDVYEETLEPFETTGGYGCHDCKSKLDN